MTRRVLLLALPLALAACGTVVVETSSMPSSSTAVSSMPASSAPASSVSSQPAAASTVTIQMSEKGFEPATVTIKSGDTVTFINVGAKAMWPASGPHPTHTGLPGFDALKGIKPGDTYSYTFTKVGTWPFHDHLNPQAFGAVTVQ